MTLNLWDYTVMSFKFQSGQLWKEGLINFLVFIGVYSRPLYDANTNLSGKRAIVTGGNRGIGRSVVELLAQRGANIVIGCRDVAAGEKVAQDVSQKNPHSKITVTPLDLTCFDSVEKFANQVMADNETIDILVNNAGISGNTYTETSDEFEQVVQVNVLSPVLLTCLLSKKLKEANGVIANVSSLAHHMISRLNVDQLECFSKFKYNYPLAYAESKLLLMLASKHLNTVINGIKCITVDPGASQTDLFRSADSIVQGTFSSSFMRPFTRTTEESANSIVQSILNYQSRSKHAIHGYMKDGKYICPSRAARNRQSPERVWDLIVKCLGSRLQY